MFLVRACKFHVCRRCAGVMNVSSVRELHLPLLNLNRNVQYINYKALSSNTNLSASDISIKKYLEYLTNVYTDPHTKTDDDTKEILNIGQVAELLNQKIEVIKCIDSLKDLVSDDKEMIELVKKEEKTYKRQMEGIDERLLETLLENLGKAIHENVIVEISAGVGGQEAMLFVKDLYKMYIGYLNYLGLNYDIMELTDTEYGGIRNATISVSGQTAFEKLRYEGGVHRVQRIPSTEKSGRMHTSTATVAVLPEPSDVEITLNDADLKIEAKRASGSGGQHVNTTDSAIRILHIPSGVAVTCQMNKSQLKNKEWALKKLRSILYEQKLEKQTTFTTSLRKRQVGLGMRNEKVRTYNYNQDRVTDHRIQNGTMHNLQEFMEGGPALEELEDKLHKDMQAKILMEILQKSLSELK